MDTRKDQKGKKSIQARIGTRGKKMEGRDTKRKGISEVG